MKKLSVQFWLVAVFMALQLVVSWVVYFLLDTKANYLIHETYLAVTDVVLLVAMLLRIAKNKGIKNRPTAIQIVLIVLAVLCIISTICGLDPATSLIGRKGRYEGLYSIFCYYLLCGGTTTVTEERERKMLLHEFLLIGLISSVIGILMGMNIIKDWSESWSGVACHPFGNPNNYGSMVAMVAGVAFAMMLYAKSKKEQAVGAISLFIAFLATFCCDSSSPLVGNIMMFLLVIFAELIVRIKDKDKKRFRKVLVGIAVALALWVGSATMINVLRNGSVSQELSQDAYYMDEGLTSDKMFSNRMGVWKFTISKLPEYWLTGVGPENFRQLIIIEDVPQNLFTFDKVHNEYLHLAICQGVPTLCVYLMFLFAIFIPGLRKWFIECDNMPIYILSFMAYFAYIAQAFFNFSVIQVAPYFWILCGLSVIPKSEKVHSN